MEELAQVSYNYAVRSPVSQYPGIYLHDRKCAKKKMASTAWKLDCSINTAKLKKQDNYARLL